MEFSGDLLDMAQAAGPAQGCSDFHLGNFDGGCRSGGQLQQGPGEWSGEAAAAIGGRLEHRRIVLT
ncbi:hypothetical protein GCM10020219_078130 [Nonomuraea dietziae]